MKFQIFQWLQRPLNMHPLNKYSVQTPLLSKRSALGGALVGAVFCSIVPGSSSPVAIAHQANPEYAASDSLADAATLAQTPVLDIENMSIAPISVLNPGAEPRQILKFNPVVNSQQQSVMRMDMQGTMNTSGFTQTLPPMPTTQFTLSTEVDRIDEAGNRYIDFEYTDVSVADSDTLPPEAIEAMRSQLQQMEGLSGSWMINEQGYLSQFAMTPPENMSGPMAQSLQQMTDSMQQMSAPLPTEAIGIGAQWQMPYDLSMNGIDMSGVATYELVSIEGDRITLNTSVTQQGNASTLTGLGLPENMNMSVQQLDSSGQGIIEIDLNQVMPTYGDISMTSNSRFTVENQGTEVPIGMNMLMNMSLLSE